METCKEIARAQGGPSVEQNMKDCGTGSGVTDTYGADLSEGATNTGLGSK